MILILPLKKAFVRSHMRSGKMVNSYFDKREKKVIHVKHSKKTRVDYSEKDAQKKIQFLEAKKRDHENHIEAAKELKEAVGSHKDKGNTTFKMGDKHHDISKVSKDLNDHIKHHSNEAQSHDNHISKIKDRYKTEREHFVKKSSKGSVSKEKSEKIKSQLTGSEKQIKWANDIKKMFGNAEFADALHTHIDKEFDDTDNTEFHQAIKTYFTTLNNITDASTIIDIKDWIFQVDFSKHSINELIEDAIPYFIKLKGKLRRKTSFFHLKGILE